MAARQHGRCGDLDSRWRRVPEDHAGPGNDFRLWRRKAACRDVADRRRDETPWLGRGRPHQLRRVSGLAGERPQRHPRFPDRRAFAVDGAEHRATRGRGAADPRGGGAVLQVPVPGACRRLQLAAVEPRIGGAPEGARRDVHGVLPEAGIHVRPGDPRHAFHGRAGVTLLHRSAGRARQGAGRRAWRHAGYRRASRLQARQGGNGKTGWLGTGLRCGGNDCGLRTVTGPAATAADAGVRHALAEVPGRGQGDRLAEHGSV
ncbi:hypothetical protein D3C86_1354680 [compost metagenome]